jgi:nitroimidazol reductase NimA-like FMN-containing flavoprotein (pyridoxamine 5'-phosphate oxidase superfamily)
VETADQYLCNGSQLYTSVVVFGEIAIVRDDDHVKRWLFDRLREKYVPRDISDQLSPEYSDTGKIIVYRVAVERLTRKTKQRSWTLTAAGDALRPRHYPLTTFIIGAA